MRRSLAMVCAIVLLVFSARPAKLFRDLPSIRVHSKEVSKGRIDAPIVVTGAVHTPAPISVSAPAGSIELTTELTARNIRAVHVGDRAAVPLGSGMLLGKVVAIEQDTVEMPIAVIKVAATERELPPGARCSIVFDGARRRSTVRVPNAALSFNPSADVLKTIGERHIPTVSLLTHAEHPLHVWTDDSGGFTTIEILAGDHDAQFTELVDGPLRPGDRVVTSASVPED